MAGGKKNKSKKTSGIIGGIFRLILVLIILVLIAAAALFFLPNRFVPPVLREFRERFFPAKTAVPVKVEQILPAFSAKETVNLKGGSSVTVCFGPSRELTGTLLEFIRKASGTLDLCISDLDLESVSVALLQAKKKGVEIRIVTDSASEQTKAMDDLSRKGIPVIARKGPGKMRQNFIIRDASAVWTGSFDFTEESEKRNDEDILIFSSPDAAALYLKKFNEYCAGKFGTKAVRKTEHGKFFEGKTPVEVLFSPADKVFEKVAFRIAHSQKKILLMSSDCSSEQIAGLLGNAAKRGIEVSCLLDRRQKRARLVRNDYVKGCGVKIHLSGNRYGVMNHNMIILDDETVILGSYDFSDQTEQYNDANLLVISDRSLAECCTKEFERCLQGTKGY